MPLPYARIHSWTPRVWIKLDRHPRWLSEDPDGHISMEGGKRGSKHFQRWEREGSNRLNHHLHKIVQREFVFYLFTFFPYSFSFFLTYSVGSGMTGGFFLFFLVWLLCHPLPHLQGSPLKFIMHLFSGWNKHIHFPNNKPEKKNSVFFNWCSPLWISRAGEFYHTPRSSFL